MANDRYLLLEYMKLMIVSNNESGKNLRLSILCNTLLSSSGDSVSSSVNRTGVESIGESRVDASADLVICLPKLLVHVGIPLLKYMPYGFIVYICLIMSTLNRLILPVC